MQIKNKKVGQKYLNKTNILQDKNYSKDKAEHKNKGVNPTRGCNICKRYASKQEHLNIHKQILTDIKGEADSNSVTVGTLRPQFTAMDRSDRNTVRKHWT